MNTQNKIVSNLLLMASISVLIISVIGLVVLAENGYAHAWLNDDIINDKGRIKNVNTDLPYSDYIVQNVENPYEDGWD
ncbi:MAG TPA: hypothetical protein VH481_04075 [Nitrososphaeraceae archaeon]